MYEHNGFRALIELAPDFITLLDLTGVIKYVSPAVTRVLGYHPNAVLGRPFTEFLHPEDLEKGREDLGRLHASSENVSSTLRYRHKDGSWRILETMARNYTGVPALEGILVSTRDITQHVERERMLKETLREADDLYNNAPCGYHSLDKNGDFVRINDTELRWLGYTREEIVGRKNIRDLLAPESRPLFEREFFILKKLGSVYDIELVLTRKDGTSLPVLLGATAARDANGEFIASRSTLYDITERKRTESALRRVNRALRVLSAVNSKLIHSKTEAILLDAVCGVIVDLGGYRMAWVGFAQQDAGRTVRPVAQVGFEQGYLERANITWSDDERGRGPTGTAIRTGKPQVNRNFLGNPLMSPWRDDAIQRGYQSSIALPMRDASGPFGALNIYAAEPDAFDAEEIDLLTELADDLAYGIMTLRARVARKRAEETVQRLAYFDPLTGLPNRNRLFEQLERCIAQPASGQAGPALLTLNVDGFSDIQSGLGVRQADALLKHLAGRLQSEMREGEMLARIGGDVFAVLLGRGDPGSARECARRIEHSLAKPFQVADVPVNVQLNIGAVVAPAHGEDSEVLLVRSGIAARQAKRSGTGYMLYAGTAESESPRWLALVSELRRAIEQRQLVLHYQPKIAVATGAVSGAEALVRWQHPERGQIPPGEFIAIAEQTGLIKPLTYYVLEHALHQLSLWRKQGFEIPVAVNVSPRNLSDPEFLPRVLGLLQSWKIRPQLLQLEITETTLMEEPAKTHDLLARLADYGISISIDDFGTGFSSLSYVATLPIQSLKIDRSFVIRMLESPRIHSVVAATISLAGSLGIKTVAEGAENREQAEELIRMGCDEIQGYFFSRPIDADELSRWVAAFSLARYALAAKPG